MKKKLLTGFAFSWLITGCATTLSNENFRITQTARGAMITSLDRVMFDTGKHEVKPSGLEVLRTLAVTLNTKTKAKILVEGHTDNIGGDNFNQSLSERRADAVKVALTKYGIDQNRITTLGIGEKSPLTENTSEIGRAQNRRTEIILLGESAKVLTGEDGSLSGILNQLKNSLVSQGAINAPMETGKKLTLRKISDVTHCPSFTAKPFILINKSEVDPQIVLPGTTMQHAVTAQICQNQSTSSRVKQAVNILQKGKIIFRGSALTHENITRATYQFFTMIDIPKNAPGGNYEIESIVAFDGKNYRQTVSFLIK